MLVHTSAGVYWLGSISAFHPQAGWLLILGARQQSGRLEASARTMCASDCLLEADFLVSLP